VLFIGFVLAGSCGLSAACSSDNSFDRDGAVNAVIDRTGGRLTREQAECYVDRAVEELGASVLEPDAELTPQQDGRLTVIRVDCIGIANLGLGGSTTTRPLGAEDTWARRLPQRLGDDPQLDLLYRSCDQGVGAACDQLFELSPAGSDYEEFAVTCGGRTRELSCAQTYPGVTTTMPPTTTVPPTTTTPQSPGAGLSTNS
jgi:hypothetical protein